MEVMKMIRMMKVMKTDAADEGDDDEDAWADNDMFTMVPMISIIMSIVN